MTALSKPRTSFRPRKMGGIDLPVKGGVKIWAGAFLVIAAGFIAPASAALGLRPVGKATDTVDNTTGADGDVTAHVEFPTEKTLMPFISESGHTFAQTDMGNKAFILDDQTATTVGTAHSVLGTAWLFEAVGSAQIVWVELEAAASEDLEGRVETLEADLAGIGTVPNIQSGRAALVSGVLNVTTGVAITASSRIMAIRTLAGGTPGVELRTLTADRTNGIAGVGAFKVRSFDSSGAAQTLDTSTVEYLIVG